MWQIFKEMDNEQFIYINAEAIYDICENKIAVLAETESKILEDIERY